MPDIATDCTNCFWNARKMIRIGRVIIALNAKICPQKVYTESFRPRSACGSVRYVLSRVTSVGQSRSPHARMKDMMATVA